MAKSKLFCVACIFAAVCRNWQPAFVPPARVPQRSTDSVLPVSLACAAALVQESSAHADAIDDAAKKLSAASYPFLQEIPWFSDIYATIPKRSAFTTLKAINSALIHGAAMDPSALKAGVQAHSKAIQGMDAKGVCTLADYEAINSAIGHMIASTPTSLTMDVYGAFAAILPKEVPGYLVSTVTASNAQAAYKAFLEFKDVVKASQR